MRPLIVPICLAVSAWAYPTGSQSDLMDPASVTVIVKSAATAPAELPGQIIAIDDIAPEGATPEIGLTDLGFLPEPAAPRIPLPPRRAIPHEIVCEALAHAAASNDLPAPFFIRLIWQESGFKQNVVSPAGAQGVAQFMPETAARNGLNDPFDPLAAVRASAQLLRNLFQQFGNLGLAAAAYNAGPKRVQDWLDRRGHLPQETRDYVQRITGRAAEDWKALKSATPLHVPASAPCQKEAGLFAANGPQQIPMPPANPATQAPVKTIVLASAARKIGHPANRKTFQLASAEPMKLSPESDDSAQTKPSVTADPKPKAKHAAKVAEKAKPAAKKTAETAKHGGKSGHGKKVRVAAADHGRK